MPESDPLRRDAHVHVNALEAVWQALKRRALATASCDAMLPSDETSTAIVRSIVRNVAPDLTLREGALEFYAAEFRDMVRKCKTEHGAPDEISG